MSDNERTGPAVDDELSLPKGNGTLATKIKSVICMEASSALSSDNCQAGCLQSLI